MNVFFSKFAWILPATGVAAAGVFWIHKNHELEFASFEQYADFSNSDDFEETLQVKTLTTEKNTQKEQEFQQIINSKKSDIEKHKTTIEIDENVFLKNHKNSIPYSIDEQIIKSSVKNIPNNEKNIHYYVDYLKNNEEGTIKISVFAVIWKFDKDLLALFYSHSLLKEKTISGFKKMNLETIAKERVVKLIFSKNNFWTTISSEGSGFVVGKQSNKPYYYIATNKHVVSAFIDNDDSDNWQSQHNLVPFAINENKQTMFASTIDAKNFQNKTNIKINFKNDVNVLANNCPGHNLQQLCDLKKHIKKIELIKDYSQPFIDVVNSGDQKINFANLNHQYNFSKTVEERKNEVFLDMAIFGVEFKSSESDPFEKWWNLRPTQFKSFEMKDVFYDDSFKKNLLISTHVPTQNICGTKEPIAKNGLHFGKSYSSPFIWNTLQKRKFSKNSQLGKIFYDSWSDLATKGSSGSPVFDKNLNIIGINWGGVLPKNQSQCSEFEKQKSNIFSWLSISKEIKDFRNNEEINKEIDSAWSEKQKQWNAYNYIWPQ